MVPAAVLVVAGLVFALWVGVVSLVMLTRPEIDCVGAVRPVFAH